MIQGKSWKPTFANLTLTIQHKEPKDKRVAGILIKFLFLGDIQVYGLLMLGCKQNEREDKEGRI